jgi:integrase
MRTYSTWRIEPTKILTRRELASVLADLHARARHSESARLNLVIFRLACCCGLRASEIAGLRCEDVIVGVGVARPHLRIRAATAKGQRSRQVPLWWDAGTLGDLKAWKESPVIQRAARYAPFVGCQKPGWRGEPLKRHSLRRRFLTACKILGCERLHTLTIHHGRHTFISHALAGGRSLAEVRVAAGHTSLLTTSAYLHIAVDDEGQVGTLFAEQHS